MYTYYQNYQFLNYLFVHEPLCIRLGSLLSVSVEKHVFFWKFNENKFFSAGNGQINVCPHVYRMME